MLKSFIYIYNKIKDKYVENIENIYQLYSNEKLPLLFKGGYINFGFWQKVSLLKSSLTHNDLIIANSHLYKIVFKSLGLNKLDRVLEIGSGYGAGSFLLNKTYNIQSFVGVDYLQAHIDVSAYNSKNLSKVKYVKGKAEELPFLDNSFDKIYTIEAFQHFNVSRTVAELQRVLAKNGCLVICGFFANQKEDFSNLLQLFPRPAILPDNDNETNAVLPSVLEKLKAHGFSRIQVAPLGPNIWYGFDKWVRQTLESEWNKNWLVAYQKNLLDYYLIKAELNSGY